MGFFFVLFFLSFKEVMLCKSRECSRAIEDSLLQGE